MHSELVETAARIFCEQQLTDYRVAKQRAFEQMACLPGTPLPDNAAIESAVVAYQRLFGGASYWQHLRALREAAVQAMKLLAPFEPCLVGGAVSGAVTLQHRVQLQVFADTAETVDLFLMDRGIPYREGARRYRDGRGRDTEIPLVQLEAGPVGLDIAVFPVDGQRQAPMSPIDGRPTRRLRLTQVEALLREPEARP